MEARLQPCVKLPLEENILDEIVDKAKDWALMHGVCMRSKTNFTKDSLNFAPFSLFPSSFPRKEFERAVSLQPLINELMHKVAYDHEFLQDTLKNTIKVDDFTKRLYSLYDEVRRKGFGQRASLGLLRSDYLSQSFQDNLIKQVEVNTIASSFGGIATYLVPLHRYVLQELGYSDLLKNLPENGALQGLCTGMLDAWKLFGNNEAVIMLVEEDVTYNICDQRFHEFEIRKLNPDVKVIRRTLTQIGKQAIMGPKKELIIDGLTVAVVYYRAGYEPAHYPTDTEWGARLTVEQSSAIKCPSIQYHLAGTKKVQQALARPGCLERFIKDKTKADAVRSIFTGLYSLDFGEAGEDGVRRALEEPHRYVLKPQREGGGNNVYGDEVRSVLSAMKDSDERSAWILMDRILPPVQSNYILRPGLPVSLLDIVCELGVFGVVLGDEKTIQVNRQVGHMVRSKMSQVDEGGVVAGAGALDSPYLT